MTYNDGFNLRIFSLDQESPDWTTPTVVDVAVDLSSLISGRDVSIGVDALARRFLGHIPASVAVGESQRQMRCNIVVLHLDASLVRAGLVRGVSGFGV